MDSNLNDDPGCLANATGSLTEGPSIATLAAVLPTLTGLYGWLTLFLICCVFEACRRVAFQAWDIVVDSLWVTIDFDEGDRSYLWIMLWLSQHPTLIKARKVAISTSSFGLETPVDDFDDSKNGPKVRFLVPYNYVSTFWYKRRYVRVSRSEVQFSPLRPATQFLHINILGGSHQIVQDLLVEARECWKKASEERVSVYASDAQNDWRLIGSHPKRPPSSIILDSGVKDDLLRDACDFLSSKRWYSERGIPFRRGYLLYGAPGSGKTSLIQSIAGELNLDVYIISLSRSGLDDNGLRELISELPERCIALMEDIDVAFHHTLNRELPDEGKAPDATDGPNGAGTPQDRSGRISLSGLLNALDGVGAQEGRILFATTNRFEALDPALRRPGRIDYVVEFKLASQYQVGELFKKFYLPTPRTSAAQRLLYKDPATSKGKGGNQRTSTSGSGTPAELETEKLIDVELPMGMQDQSLAVIVHRSKREAELSSEDLDFLVERFRELIPEGKFSMAALQGYLLMHKTQPRRAIECAGKWVKEEMKKRGSD